MGELDLAPYLGADFMVNNFATTVEQQDSLQSPEHALVQLSVSADNALASKVSVMDNFARDSVLAENAANNTQDAGSSISMQSRDDNDYPATSTKPVAQQCSPTIVPAVSPPQVGTREAPILVEDGIDDEGDVEHQDADEDGVEQHDIDGEFNLLIYAFGGDTEQEDEEIEEVERMLEKVVWKEKVTLRDLRDREAVESHFVAPVLKRNALA